MSLSWGFAESASLGSVRGGNTGPDQVHPELDMDVQGWADDGLG